MGESLDIAGALDRVGSRLQAEYADEPIPSAVLIEAVVVECGCRPDSELPSDRCYNRTNDGIKLENSPIFIHEGRGRYRYVGPNYPYSGPLYHKPKHKEEPERVVGQWTAGRLELTG